MSRGFNLLELTIIIAILGMLLVMAIPSFGAISDKVKMKRLASELNSFLIQSKTEAVTRNQRVYAHFSFLADDSASLGTWHIQLTDSALLGGNSLLYFSGTPFVDIDVRHSYNPAYITFDQVRGRPNGGSIAFSPVAQSSSKLKVVMANPPGRVKICGVNGVAYGYPTCH